MLFTFESGWSRKNNMLLSVIAILFIASTTCASHVHDKDTDHPSTIYVLVRAYC